VAAWGVAENVVDAGIAIDLKEAGAAQIRGGRLSPRRATGGVPPVVPEGVSGGLRQWAAVFAIFVIGLSLIRRSSIL